MHGYQIIQEISERSGWTWKPSPGSVYPAIQLLEDEGLIHAEGAGGRRVVALTDAGKTYAAEHADKLSAAFDTGGDDREASEAAGMQALIAQLAMALFQLVQVGTPAEVEAAKKVLTEARRSLYRILADADPTASPDPATYAENSAEAYSEPGADAGSEGGSAGASGDARADGGDTDVPTDGDSTGDGR